MVNLFILASSKVKKNAELDIHGHIDYDFGFDARATLSFSGTEFVKNAVDFGVDISFSFHADNRKKIYLNSLWKSKKFFRKYHNDSIGSLFFSYY